MAVMTPITIRIVGMNRPRPPRPVRAAPGPPPPGPEAVGRSPRAPKPNGSSGPRPHGGRGPLVESSPGSSGVVPSRSVTATCFLVLGGRPTHPRCVRPTLTQVASPNGLQARKWHHVGVSDLSQILTKAAADTERHVARLGWDQPPRLFALVRTGALVDAEPGLRGQLLGAEPDSLTSVEQEGMAPTSNVETMLGSLGWPDAVDGAAIALERIVVPPEAERDLPLSPTQATEALTSHPA